MRSKAQNLGGFNSEEGLSDFLLNNATETLKQAIRVTIKALIKSEMDEFRKTVEQKLSFNGSYDRNLISPMGLVSGVEVPRFRQSGISDVPLQSLGVFGSEQERFFRIVSEMHRTGVSQRKVSEICRNLFGITVSKNRVGEVHRDLVKQESFQINQLPLPVNIIRVILDGIWVKCKSFGLTEGNDMVLLCALGITRDGGKKVIGFDLAEQESYEAWSELIVNLKQRGLKAEQLDLAIRDDSGGLGKALDQLFPKVPQQICIIHKMRDVTKKIPAKQKRAVAQELKMIYRSKDKAEAIDRFKQFAKNWYVRYPQAVSSLQFHFEKTLTYFDFPKEIWHQIRTTNSLERQFREVRRRIKVFDNSFNHEASLKNYANSTFTYLNDHLPSTALHTKA